LTEIIHLNVGEEHLVKLTGLGSAGYLWDFAVEKGSTLLSVANMPTEKPVTETGRTPSSYSTASSFLVKALAPGEARVRFTLQRPWLIGKVAPLKEHVLAITIQ
jgi:predicted secreted protein